jgi:hypothetical protein
LIEFQSGLFFLLSHGGRIQVGGFALNQRSRWYGATQYEDYWYLGTSASGSITCLIEETGNIVAIDVQNNNKETVINSSMI